MKKQIIIFLALLLILPICSADCAFYGNFEVNKQVELVQTCTSCSSINASLVYPDSTNEFIVFQNINGMYNYTFNNTSQLGAYNVIGSDAWCYYFNINPTGTSFDTSQSSLFIIFLLIFILFLVGGILGMSKAINGSWQIAYICLSYISLFAIFFISWLYSSNYLYQTPILASIFWILWLILAFGFFPFILVIGTYIIGKGIKDNLIKEYKSQGYTEGEAREMASKRR